MPATARGKPDGRSSAGAQTNLHPTVILNPNLSLSSTVQETFQHLNILIRLFIRRKMAALLEEDERGAGDGMRQSPGGERRDVHVIAAGDDQSWKLEAGQFGREVQVGGGFG